METQKHRAFLWSLVSRSRLCLACSLCAVFATAQTPFLRTGQVFSTLRTSTELQLYTVQAGYNSISADPIGNLPAGGVDAIGFRSTDNFLYGIGISNNHLYRIGQNAAAQDLGPVGLDNNLFYLAGDITPDGQYLYSIGSDAAGNDVHLAKTDLNTLLTQKTLLAGAGNLSDIAVEPGTGALWGFDLQFSRMVRIQPANGNITNFPAFTPGNTLFGLYFDAFGDLYGVGSTLYGVVDGHFIINRITGLETRLTTGPSSFISDAAACPFSVEMKSQVNPPVALPCSEIQFNYTLVNGSNETFNGLEFIHPLPSGFHLRSVAQNGFGATVDTISMPGSIRIQNITLAPGVRNLSLKLWAGDIPKGRYNSQPMIQNLPALYGNVSLSDNTREPGFEDSTAFVVNRFDEDTLSSLWFICHGETLTLDAAAFGGGVQWNTGVYSAALSVGQGGIFNFTAGTTCEEVFVTHDVTSASCPYTIAVAHTFEPDTSFACNEVVFRFVVRNDSGEPRFDLAFCDTLPDGMVLLEVLRNPFGGEVVQSPDGNQFCITGMTLKPGFDTLEVMVQLPELPPGKYKNRAYLNGLPLVMGPFRQSDNPLTFEFDSSVLVIRGALSDTLLFDTLICANASMQLDAGPYGKTFLWENGATEPVFKADSAGVYQVQIFDGCKPAQLIWTLLPAPLLDVLPLDPVEIHQGEAVVLQPEYVNGGDSLAWYWTDPLGQSLSCVSCLETSAAPLESVVYVFKMENEWCTDSVLVPVLVDQSRRVYTPNVFSPNDDGEHDFFYFQSPDFAQIDRWQIFDRWGNLAFEVKSRELLDGSPAWDGNMRGKEAPPGVYTWFAVLKFVDGRTKEYSGQVTLIR